MDLRAAGVRQIEGHLDAGPTLEQMAAAAHLCAYHFARQFKAATGLPPHQFVLARRVDRAQQLLRRDGHAAPILHVRKNRIKVRKSLQEHGPRAL